MTELAIFQSLLLLFNVNVSISNIIAVAVSTVFNFAMNGMVTFKESSNLPRSVVLYLLLFFFNTIFSTTVITTLVNSGTPPLIAKIITMACIVLWNFILYKKVVFK